MPFTIKLYTQFSNRTIEVENVIPYRKLPSPTCAIQLAGFQMLPQCNLCRSQVFTQVTPKSLQFFSIYGSLVIHGYNAKKTTPPPYGHPLFKKSGSFFSKSAVLLAGKSGSLKNSCPSLRKRDEPFTAEGVRCLPNSTSNDILS